MAGTITKFLYSALEERLTDVAYRADKDDPTMMDDNIGRATRVYQEANISAVVGPLLHALAETHGSSPTYDSFPASVRALSQVIGGIFLGILKDEGFFEVKWSTKEIKNWINRTAKPQMREAVVSMIYTHCRSDRGQGWGSLCPSSQQQSRYRTTGCIFKDINTFYSHRIVSSTDTIW